MRADRKPLRRRDVPTSEDVQRLVEAASPAMRLRIVFAATTASRYRELRAARWGDIDIYKGTVALRGDDRAGILFREVPLDPELWNLMMDYIGSTSNAVDEFIFTDERGRQLTLITASESYLGLWRERAKRGDSDPYFPWYCLRRFAATRWYSAGVPAETIYRWLGRRGYPR